MSKRPVDILQIRKYLDGELDASAMHRLERQALDDPFLAEALEGYQKASSGQQVNLDDLQLRLKQRTGKREARIIPFRYMSAAAAVLIVCTVGLWWFGREPHEKKITPDKSMIAGALQKRSGQDTVLSAPKRTRSDQVTVPAEKMAANIRSVYTAPRIKHNKASENVSTEGILKKMPGVNPEASNLQSSLTAKDTTPLNEMIAMGYTSSKKRADTPSAVRKVSVFKSFKAGKDTVPEQRLAAQAPGVQVYPDLEQKADLDEVIEEGKLASIPSNQPVPNRLILGRVVNIDNGVPVKGASVQVIGTTQVAMTDSRGFFRVKADTAKGNLLVSNSGYRSKQVSANLKDSVNTIALQPSDNEDVSEDIATGFTSQAKDTDEPYYVAHPAKGWSSYRAYLKINAVSADGATGVVKVSFTVDKYGTISNIKIIKGLTDAANKKAVSLLTDGPDWTGNSNKMPRKVTLRIKFGK